MKNLRRGRDSRNRQARASPFIIGLFVSVEIISLREVHTVGNLTKMIYEHPLVVSNAALNAGLNMTKMHRCMKDVTLSTSTDELDRAVTSLNTYEKLVYQELDVIKKLIIGAEGQKLEKRTRSLFNDWKPIRDTSTLNGHSR